MTPKKVGGYIDRNAVTVAAELANNGILIMAPLVNGRIENPVEEMRVIGQAFARFHEIERILHEVGAQTRPCNVIRI